MNILNLNSSSRLETQDVFVFEANNTIKSSVICWNFHLSTDFQDCFFLFPLLLLVEFSISKKGFEPYRHFVSLLMYPAPTKLNAAFTRGCISNSWHK